ncbi:hypothetical protein MASR2M69_08490 [Bacteroidota bacterium]
MSKIICEIFENDNIIKKIKEKLPYLFQLAEIDNSRNGKLGMEIGSTRERIIISLLIYHYGPSLIGTDISITQNEIDVRVNNEPISIKTVTSKKIIGVKLIWTVDSQKALDFIKSYSPGCDILYVHINWGGQGGLYLISKESQSEILRDMGKELYFKLPKQGTNPRGIELSNDAINKLVEHHMTKKIEIYWLRNGAIEYNAYDRWVDLWNKD